MNTLFSQVGDIDPIIHDAAGDASYSKTAWWPTLYGSDTIAARSMAIYEKFGNDEKDYGRQIACCNIRSLWVTRDYATLEDARERGVVDENTEIITEAEFDKMFEGELSWDQVAMDDWTMEDVVIP